MRTCAALPSLLLLAAATAANAPVRAADGMRAPDAPAAPISSSFTYQGFLTSADAPADGVFDFEFALYDDALAGVQVGATQSVGDLEVRLGVFTAQLDFGMAAFPPGARFLEIRVRPGASIGAFTPLTPRQPVTGAPLALAQPNLYADPVTGFVGVGRDFRVSSNEVFGVRSQAAAGQYGGMYVETTDVEGWPFYGYATAGAFRAWTYLDLTEDASPAGWKLYLQGVRLRVPPTGGLRIGPAADYSLVLENSTGSDGLRILDIADDGIQIGSDPDYPNYGLYIPSPGVSTYGLWSNTANAAGEWALYTVDKINAGNVAAAGYTQLARVAGEEAVSPGDLIAAVGAEPAPTGMHDAIPAVAVADQKNREALIGVVKHRMELRPAEGKEGADAFALHSADGPAEPGDYVALVVQGVALVRVEDDEAIAAGQRLAAGDTPGRVRALRTRQFGDLVVSEGVAVLGVALGPSEDGWVRVYVRAN